jgi:hypothetical protein
MLFVNRYDEVFKLLEANVHGAFTLTNGRRVVNLRSFHFYGPGPV